MQGMNTNDLQTKLKALPNVTEFAQHYKLSLRTLMRIRSGKSASRANAKVISEALTWFEKRTGINLLEEAKKAKDAAAS